MGGFSKTPWAKGGGKPKGAADTDGGKGKSWGGASTWSSGPSWKDSDNGYEKGYEKGKYSDKGWGKGKDKGKDKGKGKPRGPSGPNLPRERITDEAVTGTCSEWKGKYGWITPTTPMNHPMAVKHQGRLYISVSDLVGVTELTEGSVCQFHVFQDASGLGAEECIGS
mmetsp:Transcript_26324/g.60744  ORF Transcript_26324/g.60744 Transcript_26324/m.60744 type:complete len:167 (-) Transcript_26324:54-554(-)